jgi:hypothetical protein
MTELPLLIDPASWARARQRACDLDLKTVKRCTRITVVAAALWPRAMYWRVGRELVTHCPWHADTHPSFCINRRKQMAFCHPCGFAGDVFDLVMAERGCSLAEAVVYVHDATVTGRRPLRVWDTPAPRRTSRAETTSTGRASERTQVYPYCDRHGHERYQVVRLPGKRFRCRHWDAQARRWVWNLAGRAPLIYHGDLLWRLAQEDGLDWCLVVEGEKPCDAAWSLSVPATTNHGGAGRWTVAHAQQLFDLGVRRVTILPDNDPVGEDHMQTVATTLAAPGEPTMHARVLRLPNLPLKGDLFDWVASGGTSRELLRLLRRCWA